MVTWNNLDKLASFEELKKVERVNLAEVMSGENGAERVKSYSVPMAEGLAYNYAAKQVNEDVLAALVKLAEEAQLSEKFEELYNGAVINTGENRLVLHQLTRGQLGNTVTADGVDKRAFYVEQQNRIAEFANKVHAGEITNAAGENSPPLCRSVSAEATLARVRCIWLWKTGQRKTAASKWKQNSSATLTRMTQQLF